MKKSFFKSLSPLTLGIFFLFFTGETYGEVHMCTNPVPALWLPLGCRGPDSMGIYWSKSPCSQFPANASGTKFKESAPGDPFYEKYKGILQNPGCEFKTIYPRYLCQAMGWKGCYWESNDGIRWSTSPCATVGGHDLPWTGQDYKAAFDKNIVNNPKCSVGPICTDSSTCKGGSTCQNNSCVCWPGLEFYSDTDKRCVLTQELFDKMKKGNNSPCSAFIRSLESYYNACLKIQDGIPQPGNPFNWAQFAKELKAAKLMK